MQSVLDLTAIKSKVTGKDCCTRCEGLLIRVQQDQGRRLCNGKGPCTLCTMTVHCQLSVKAYSSARHQGRLADGAGIAEEVSSGRVVTCINHQAMLLHKL